MQFSFYKVPLHNIDKIYLKSNIYIFAFEEKRKIKATVIQIRKFYCMFVFI